MVKMVSMVTELLWEKDIRANGGALVAETGV
jgi:hypothetical protein